MYIITVAGHEDKGAYTVFESTGAPEMNVMEVEDELILRTCDIHNYKYSIITPNDMVIPPKDTHDFI